MRECILRACYYSLMAKLRIGEGETAREYEIRERPSAFFSPAYSPEKRIEWLEAWLEHPYKKACQMVGVSELAPQRWRKQDTGFAEAYADVSLARAARLADETLEIADEAPEQADALRKAELRVRGRQWLAGRTSKDYAERSTKEESREVRVTIQLEEPAPRAPARIAEDVSALVEDDGEAIALPARAPSQDDQAWDGKGGVGVDGTLDDHTQGHS